MDVRIAYDDDVLYVGARMHSKDGRIQAPLGRRDNVDQAEHILVSFDTFLDRRTAVVFGVTAAGVRIDRYHSSDTEEIVRRGFRSRLARRDQGRWRSVDRGVVDSVFAAAVQPAHRSDVGIEPVSLRPTLDEADYWILIPRTVRAWSSRFGDISGLNGIVPPRRIEALPYIAGGFDAQWRSRSE